MRYRLAFLVIAGAITTASAGCGEDGRTGTHPPGPLAPPAIPDPTHGPITDADIDGDGIPNEMDICPSVANADQRRACEYPDPPIPTGDVAADGLAHLNWIRHIVGLPAVTQDLTSTHGCQVHLDYLEALSAEVGSPQLGHQEDLSKPYASAEGNRAGINSVLSLGQSDISDAIDGWINTLYHRLPLLHPGLQTVGIAYQNRYACILYRDGTDERVVAPHPIFWPPPDIVGTDRQFGGNESPCPTVENPLGGGACPSSAAIPTVGLNGLGSLSAVTATYLRYDASGPVPLFHLYYDGGPSPHEQMGYLGGSVAYVPLAMTSLANGGYEVTVNARVGATEQTYRWRFRTGRDLPPQDSAGCNDHGMQSTFATAFALGTDELTGKICAPEKDYFVVGGSGMRHIQVDYDYSVGDIDVKAYAPGMMTTPIATSESTTNREQFDVPAGTIIEVYGFGGAGGLYLISAR